MIEVRPTPAPIERVDSDAVVVGAAVDGDGYELGRPATRLDEVSSGALSRSLDALRFKGSVDKVAQVVLDLDGRTVVAIVVGLGKRVEVDAERIRLASASAAKAATKFGAVATALSVELDDVPTATKAAIEGTLLALYRFDHYADDDDKPAVCVVEVIDADADSVRLAVASCRATILARDLVNTPASDLKPAAFVEAMIEVADNYGLAIDVWDEARIVDERLGGVIAVAAGSDSPPMFVELSYEPEHAVATVALVGKGVTFDSGGLSLKPADNMESMKSDMAGGAAVIAAMSALASFEPNVAVRGFLPIVENMPGPTAVRPGDVFTARNGKTIEVLNTDAEGRLILADALTLASESKPDAIVDVATLTGAGAIALGDKCGALFSNDDKLAGDLLAAADRSGEKLWRLPLIADYRADIDSSVADMANVGGRRGGAITAALLLAEFVDEDVPWAHIDMAGPARAKTPSGYVAKGGTGFAVRTLIEFVVHFSV